MPYIRNHQYYRALIRILAGGLLVLARPHFLWSGPRVCEALIGVI